MENISLHTRLRAMTELNVLQVKFDLDRHVFKGEGTLCYKGTPIKILADYVGKAPDDSMTFTEPTDVAYCPKEKVMLCYAKSVYEPFTPLTTFIRRRSLPGV